MHTTAFSPQGSVIYHVSNADGVSQIENEAMQLLSQLGSADCRKANTILRQLISLAGSLPLTGRHSHRVASIIAAAIAQAERQVEGMEDPKHLSAEERQALFELHVYNQMSAEAKTFYDAIDSDTDYFLAPVESGGKTLVSERKNIEGRQLRQSFTTIKYHSMNEEQKKDVLHQMGDKADEAANIKPPDKKNYIDAKAEVHHLQSALEEMEAYKASQLLVHSGTDINKAKLKVQENHQLFASAHRQINEVMDHYDVLTENPLDKMAIAALTFAQQKMSKVLQDEVMDRALLELNPDHVTINNDIRGGISVGDALPALVLLAALAAMRPKTHLPVHVHG